MRHFLLLTALIGTADIVEAQSPERWSDNRAAELAERAAELKARALARAPRIGATAAAVSQTAAAVQSLAGLRVSAYQGRASAGGRYDTRFTTTPRESWDSQDPADSTYRAARNALNRSNYQQAAYLFNQVWEKHPRSTYAADAYYFHAFALYREGKTEGLKRALEVLEIQADRYKKADTRDDAIELAARINAELAKRGDESAAQRVERDVEAIAQRESRGSSSGSGRSHGRSRGDCEDDEKAAAMAAILSMDADRAMPLLKRIMARQDAGSICLRRKAVFMISQHEGRESESMLLAAAQSDPDAEVRENAVFWLGQSGGERAVAALDSILRKADDNTIRDKAIFALSQHGSPRASEILRDFAMRGDAPISLRENAIFWIGQGDRPENADFLRTIYKSTKEKQLKDKIIFSLSQGGGKQSAQWLTEIVTDANEEVEARKSALFWLGQSHSSIAELFSLYDRLVDRELREQMIFVYSQRNEKAAVDKLIEIAKTDKDRELRKKALFWLGQSNDPRVPEVIESILSKP